MLGEDHPEILRAMEWWADSFWDIESYANAVNVLSKGVELSVAKLGADHYYSKARLQRLQFIKALR